VNKFPDQQNCFSGTKIELLCEDKVERESGEDLHVGPSSLDVHIAGEKVKLEGGSNGTGGNVVNVAEQVTHPEKEVLEDVEAVVVQPGEFCLARTDEYFDLPPDIMALMHGRSSIGRLGLFVENAGLVDRGFSGTLTLELYNPTNNVIKVPVQTRVAQLAFFYQGGTEDTAYDGKYQEQIDATASRAYKDDEHQ